MVVLHSCSPTEPSPSLFLVHISLWGISTMGGVGQGLWFTNGLVICAPGGIEEGKEAVSQGRASAMGRGQSPWSKPLLGHHLAWDTQLDLVVLRLARGEGGDG